MRRRPTDPHSFTRRAVILAAGKGMLAATLLGRMFYLQIYRSKHYLTLSHDNRIRLDLIPPLRGLIKDRQQHLLAENRKNFRAVIMVDSHTQVLNSLERIKEIIELEPHLLEQLWLETEMLPRGMFLTLKENLTWDEVSLLELHKIELEGISIQHGYIRHYPLEEKAVHVVGYVQSASKQEASENKLLRLPGFKLGKTGIEKTLEPILQGQPGYREVEVNASRQEVREVQQRPSIEGEEIVLTIDHRLQEGVYELLEHEKSGSAVVMDVRNGEILALVSMPSFDPNPFPSGIRSKEWQKLRQHPHNPLLNKAVAGLYPPGSIFKIIVAIAGLEKGVVSPHEKIRCTGAFTLGSHPFHCHKKGGHGSLNLKEALIMSCDVFFYELALRLGIDTIAHFARAFGLGTPTGIEIPGEQAGLIPDKHWKRRRYKKSWMPADTVMSGIGQGYFLSTPLQLAAAVARCVGGEDMVSPTLILKGKERQSLSDAPRRLLVKAPTLEFIKDALQQVVNNPLGTAYGVRIHDPQFLMGGKTGTSQVKRIHQHEREAGLLLSKNWHEREHAIFVGYAPAHDPQFVAAVVVEHGAKGGAVAGPLARDILLMTRKYMASS